MTPDSTLTRTHYTPAEVGLLLGVRERHIRDLCSTGAMPCVRVGRYWRIPIRQFEQQYGATSASA